MIKINKADGTQEIVIKLEHDLGDLWYATNLEGVVYQTTLDDIVTPQQCEAVETKNMATETLSVIKEKYGLGSRNVMKELQHKVAELEKILKDCLYEMPCSYVPNHTVANLPAMIATQAQMLGEECNHADALEKQIEKLQQEIVEVKSQYRLSSVCRELTEQRDEWKAKYIQQNKDLGCEMMDPDGTIWDRAEKVQSILVIEQWDRLAEEITQLKSQLTQTRGPVTISRNGYVQELEAQRDRLAEALENCREDSIELLSERRWWQLENRCRYQERYQTTRDNVTRADAALQSLIKP